MFSLPQTDPVTELLKCAKIIAVVGLSDNPMRVSHGVSAYMQSQGYRIIPVNIFRRPEFVEEVVAQAIKLKVPAIWMQEDVIHEKAAEKARKAGVFVVMDCCILREHRARFR
jgi:predicted CoA-binding protein